MPMDKADWQGLGEGTGSLCANQSDGGHKWGAHKDREPPTPHSSEATHSCFCLRLPDSTRCRHHPRSTPSCLSRGLSLVCPCTTPGKLRQKHPDLPNSSCSLRAWPQEMGQMLKNWGDRQNNIVTHHRVWRTKRRHALKKHILLIMGGYLCFDVQVCFKTGL